MTSRIEMAILGLGLLLIAGLVIAFISLTDGINQDLSARTDAGSPPAAGVAPTVTADAPVVLGGPSILTDASRSYLLLHFNRCEPGKGRLQLAMTSMTFEIVGLESSSCLLEYGEGEATLVACQVPASLGPLQFKTHEKGVILDKIASYCKAKD